MKTALRSIKLTKRQIKVLTSLVLVVLLTLPPLVNLFITPTHAANLTGYKVQIGDSRASSATYHNFTFVTPSTTSIKTITFQYCTTQSGTCTAPTGMILTASPVLGTVTGIAGTGYTAAGTSATCTGTGNTDCTVTLTVGTPAAQTASATVVVPIVSGVTNPSTNNTTYYARITTKDSGAVTIDGTNAAAFAILTDTSITVTATVDPNFTFTVTGITGDGSATVNGATISNGLVTTANTIPFGTLNTGAPKIAAQDITVSTNSNGGYTVTASHAATITGNPPMVSGATNNIDTFNDSGASNTAPGTWSSPAGSTANTDTGYFGYTTNDTTLCTGTPNRFSSNKWAGTTTTGQEVACSASSVTSETTRLGYQAEVNSSQPAGVYTGTVILVATPTY